MSLFKRIFAPAAPPAAPGGSNSQPASQFPPSSTASSGSPLAQQNAGRRELLRLVLRDTLNRTGIPTSWVGADLLAATSRGREPGIHVRFLLKHWDPRLMLHGIAFESAFKKRVLTLDPLAERWLLGLSWQFALPDETNCPPMPHPGVWTSSLPGGSAQPAATAAAPQGASAPADPADLLGGSIVISGPARSADAPARPVSAATTAAAAAAAAASSRAEAKADLERLFAVRDQDVQRHSQAPAPAPTFAATEPAGLTDLPSPNAFEVTAGGDVPSFAKTDVFRRPDTTPRSK